MPKGQGLGTKEYSTGPPTSPRRGGGWYGHFRLKEAAKRFRKREERRLKVAGKERM